MILTVTIHPALDRILLARQLTSQTINRVEVFRQYGGGKGNNVARALSRLGAPVLAFGFQGGETGKLAQRIFKQESIPTHFVACRQPTRISTLLIEQSTGNHYTLYEPGQKVTPKEAQELKKQFLQIIGSFQLVLFCGSAQNELADLMQELIEIAKQKGVICIVDSSGSGLRKAILAGPFMVKVNHEELEEYLQEELENETLLIKGIQKLHQQKVDVVAVSRGEEGLWISDGTMVCHASLKMSNVINVMGCGDSLLAGMSYALLNKKNLTEIAKWGTACGAANTQVLGAGFIEKTTVEQLLPRVKISQIH